MAQAQQQQQLAPELQEQMAELKERLVRPDWAKLISQLAAGTADQERAEDLACDWRTCAVGCELGLTRNRLPPNAALCGMGWNFYAAIERKRWDDAIQILEQIQDYLRTRV